MSFAIDTQCLLCHLRRNLEVVKPLGTEQQAMDNRMQEITREGKSGGKLRYVFSRMFPSLALMKDRYPSLRKFPWLAPVFYVHRFFTVIFRREAIGRELSHLKNTKK